MARSTRLRLAVVVSFGDLARSSAAYSADRRDSSLVWDGFGCGVRVSGRSAVGERTSCPLSPAGFFGYRCRKVDFVCGSYPTRLRLR